MDILIQIRESALNMLARREHSQFELRQKLASRFKEQAEEIENILLQLITDNYQSDQRFCESFIHFRQQKGYGKMRITAELMQKGINTDLMEASFNLLEVDWFELAYTLKRAKFGDTVSNDYKTRAKQYRYLQYRGFTSDQINYAIQEDSHNL